MKEQFNKNAKEDWRFAADVARITDENAGIEDHRHTSSGVVVAVDSNVGAVFGKEEGAVESIPQMYIHSPVARTFFLHTARAQSHLHILMRVTHTLGSRVSKRFFAHVSHLSISPSPVSCLTHPCGHFETIPDFDVHTCLPYLLVLTAQACASPHGQREVWLSGQVRPQHRLQAQRVRQDHFCGQ